MRRCDGLFACYNTKNHNEFQARTKGAIVSQGESALRSKVWKYLFDFEETEIDLSHFLIHFLKSLS